MKIGYLKTSGTVKVAVDPDNFEEDLLNCHKLEKLMNSDEWKILMTAMIKCQSDMVNAVMKVVPQEQSFRENAMHSARLNGFWEAMSLAANLVEAGKQYRKEKIKELNENEEDQLILT